MAPAAPSFATLFCRHSYDVSVPTIIDDLLDLADAGSAGADLFRQGMPHLCRHYSRAQMLNAMKDFREEQKHQKEIS